MRPSSGRVPANLAAAFFLMGMVATSAQVLLLRRLMSVLYGNEMVVGMALAVWMAGTGAGSLVCGRVSEARARSILALVTTASMVLVTLTVFGTYAVRALLDVPSGQVLAPGASLALSLLLLLPLTVALGAMFVLFAVVEPGARGERIGIVYLLEAAGAAAGGVASGIAASWGLSALAWSFGLAFGLLLILGFTAPRGARWILGGASIVAATAGLIWGPGRPLSEYARDLSWPDYSVIATAESRYASLVVAESGDQRTLFVNALPDLTIPNPQQAERTAHSAMLQHPNPKRVLLIGGGLSETAIEIFKHGVEVLDYVQIDPEITRLERDYLSDAGGRPTFREGRADPFSDPRISVHNADGRLFLSEGRGAPYDVIIVNTPDPATVLMNRFYTVEFFEQAEAHLSAEGVLAFTCGEMANYVSGSLGRLLSCEAATLQSVFRHYKMLPLGAVHFVASNDGRRLTADGADLAQRLDRRGIETTFMRDYYLGYDLSPGRVDYLSREVSEAYAAERPKLNRDRNPIAYFYYLTHWYRLLGSSLTAAMEFPLGPGAPYSIPAAALVGLLITGAPGLAGRRGVARALGVAAMGFATMTSQVVLLVAFQTFRGHLYHSVGLIVAAFMAGISLGALWCRRRRCGMLALPQSLLAWYCVALFGALLLPLDRVPGAVLEACAVAASMLGGLIGGAVFQRAAYGFGGDAARVASSRATAAPATPPEGDPRGNGGRAAAAAVLNASDHAGAAFGGLIAATVILPALGLSGAAALAAACAGGSAIGLALSRT